MEEMQTSAITIDSPVGPLALGAHDGRITSVSFGARPARGVVDDVLERAATQLEEYFAGERTEFDLPLALPADGLLGRVVAQLTEIPFGETVSYKELTLALGLDLSRVREVGAALGRNPIAIVVPCHRVIGSDGSLTGFGGGLERKRRLLDLESPQLQLA
jgi:methylated-DNA-[protein]-cysteine S-methyltransferase